MKTHKNIDRLFQEKLKDFEVSPPKGAWSNIEKGIHGSNKKPLIPLWFKIGSAAAILFLLTITGVNYFKTPSSLNEIDTIVSDPEKTTIPTTINPSEENLEDVDQINSSDEILIADTEIQEKKKENVKRLIPAISKKLNPNESNGNNQISSADSKFKINKKVELVGLQKNIIENNNPTDSIKTGNTSELKSIKESRIAIVKEESPKESETPEDTIKRVIVEEESSEDVISEIVENTSINSAEEIEDLLKEEEKGKEISKKWSVSTQFGPVYYNSFTADNSLIDESFITNENQINNSISAGIKVGYKLTKKLSLQSGVNIINVASQTNNVFIKTSLNPQHLDAIKYSPFAQLMTITAKPANNLFLARNEVANSQVFEGVLNQEFGYIEVPLEVKYNLTNGIVGINLIGGFSTLFLNKNTIQYETDGFSTKIGEANNLNDLNFSGNLGLDVDYKINKQLFFNISPMVKIQTNTFSSNSGNFKPYLIGVYTGLNYRF